MDALFSKASFCNLHRIDDVAGGGGPGLKGVGFFMHSFQPMPKSKPRVFHHFSRHCLSSFIVVKPCNVSDMFSQCSYYTVVPHIVVSCSELQWKDYHAVARILCTYATYTCSAAKQIHFFATGPVCQVPDLDLP